LAVVEAFENSTLVQWGLSTIETYDPNSALQRKTSKTYDPNSALQRKTSKGHSVDFRLGGLASAISQLTAEM